MKPLRVGDELHFNGRSIGSVVEVWSGYVGLSSGKTYPKSRLTRWRKSEALTVIEAPSNFAAWSDMINPPTVEEPVQVVDDVSGLCQAAINTICAEEIAKPATPAGWVTLFDDAGTPWGYQEFDERRQYGYINNGFASTLVDTSKFPGYETLIHLVGGFRVDDRRKIDALNRILNHAFDWANGAGA